MSDPIEPALLDDARAAAMRGDWRSAYQQLIEADERQVVSGPDLALLADAAYATGHLDVTIDAWERLHAESLHAGDHMTAARAAVRIALHLLFDTALLGPVRGWAARAERLLEGQPVTPVHAWLAVVRANERLQAGDLGAAREWSRRAVDLGTVHDRGAAAIGRVAEARSVILSGEVQRGLALLNEAAVAVVSGEIDPLSTGVVYCEVVCAMQGLAQYDLAEQWTQAMELWSRHHTVGSLHGRCRVHRAEILRLRGDYEPAEHEASTACEELRPYLRREFGWPLNELGRIRLHRGDLSGAEEAFLAARHAGWDPCPGLALLRLAQGNAAAAAVEIRDALEHPLNVPSKELPPSSELCRAPLLDAAVEIEIAAGNVERARSAAAELKRIAAAFGSRALLASATLAHARVALAEGNASAARLDFDAAAREWSEIGAPYETAVARMGAAQAYRAGGDEPRAIAEFRAAREMFATIGAVDQSGRASSAVDVAIGVDARASSSPLAAATAASELRHEGDFWVVAFAGRTVRLRNIRGFQHLARLLGEPQREFHVLDLVGADDARDIGDAGELLDDQAKRAYRRRLADIDEDLEDARRLNDAARITQATTEREFLLRELSRAVGLGGRDRRAGAAAERARVSATRAIRQAIDRIRAHHRDLAEHLDRTVRTGVYCVYLPDPRVATRWTV